MLSFDKEVSKQSNLDSFLNCTTPVVPSRFLSKSEMRKLNKLWHPWEREKVEFFTLGDLWDSFDEWSACGLGVPIISDGGHNLTQYFVPYLSAIQIFTSSSSSIDLRDREDMDSTSTETRNSSSDSFSDESESEKLSRWDGCSSEEGLVDQESFWNSDERLGNLYFQHFETSSPYERVPLVDKVNSFSQRYRGITTYRSVDLLPASWMAVSWYPIYHIPMGRTIKNFQTCFLTYHTLSSSFQDSSELEDNIENFEGRRKLGGESISLRPFGLATYKMQVDVWISDKNGEDGERLASLLSVADSWLKQLRVQHHDFNYFMGRFLQG
ncbi:uncharacterized protein [Primulina huaijiensis]|uniref:uncharacterized protein n=1 Tax=Primulina huaijiensis TaxID=1492673 RepID=UPI003CC7703C